MIGVILLISSLFEPMNLLKAHAEFVKLVVVCQVERSVSRVLAEVVTACSFLRDYKAVMVVRDPNFVVFSRDVDVALAGHHALLVKHFQASFAVYGKALLCAFDALHLLRLDHIDLFDRCGPLDDLLDRILQIHRQHIASCRLVRGRNLLLVLFAKGIVCQEDAVAVGLHRVFRQIALVRFLDRFWRRLPLALLPATL